MNNTPHVLIIGGSFAGIKAAEILVAAGHAVKVTIISQSTHAYFTVAAPRVLVEPQVAQQVFFAIEDKVAKLGEAVSFTQGSVNKVDTRAKTVKFRDSTGAEKLVSYDFLVVASGSKAQSAAFKLDGDYTLTEKVQQELQACIKASKEIAILGGGPTAVETAGEIGHTYGKEKNVTLYTGSKGPLTEWNPKVTDDAVQKLQAVHVKVVNGIKSTSVQETPDNKHEVQFSDGSSRTFDLTISAYGIYPNSQFLDSELLDSRGFVKTDEFLVVNGAPNVLAFGDIVSGRPCTVLDIDQVQATTFTGSVHSVIFGVSGKKRAIKKPKDMGLVPISRDGGVGIIFGWKAPSWLVRMIKSRDFMIGRGAKAFA
ncbi:LAME_0D11276g1_1 [Lachancea meyersii CBS 8951]|uniref:LAME_0D11276g1_1 n=1 Tax=Lachancea meyersii CBS 8951 TaxID=1266667 RepID=A0A1G4JCK7_9SACH|nr:LAME_0D11276g1_1 [Lachancea meyersii CBS 8951]